MYLCVRGIYFASVSTIFLLNFKTVMSQCAFKKKLILDEFISLVYNRYKSDFYKSNKYLTTILKKDYVFFCVSP